jgi:hypothetical protein
MNYPFKAIPKQVVILYVFKLNPASVSKYLGITSKAILNQFPPVCGDDFPLFSVLVDTVIVQRFPVSVIDLEEGFRIKQFPATVQCDC